jgi:hypothetical protein
VSVASCNVRLGRLLLTGRKGNDYQPRTLGSRVSKSMTLAHLGVTFIRSTVDIVSWWPPWRPSPRSCDDPTPDASSPDRPLLPGTVPALAEATALKRNRRYGLWPVYGARSVQGCRVASKTSRSTSPPQCGLPRGPRRAQPALRALLPDPSSTCASPSAWVNSTTSASSRSSRLDGPDRPTTSAVLPASMNSAFQRPIDCSETFSFRTAQRSTFPQPRPRARSGSSCPAGSSVVDPSPHLLIRRRSCPHNRPARKFVAEHRDPTRADQAMAGAGDMTNRSPVPQPFPPFPGAARRTWTSARAAVAASIAAVITTTTAPIERHTDV